ncbi:hypothetical protein [Allomuricauda sp. ARW1Y1]|jgi:hypothetical protein|uniref:hypothetical protein n=1 Tax=Allomuricauda sp. ARW1Y1 TaxID=2663843 RepID=UPI0015CE08FA|nr:hypothetical protein [Muricauda sp. ARW1Y1]NYJ27542.1 hypothetical protein [Muricauda sp. ARW1Y1]
MQTLKIEIPKGYEVESFDQSTGEIKFREKPKDITERIKSFDDVLGYHGLEKEEFEEELESMSTDEVAYRKVKLVAEALNEGWQPDWTNSSEYKYFPWFKMGGSSGSGFAYGDYANWNTDSYCGSRLCFKSSKLAKHAGEQFTDIYKDFLTS